jgi:opacity protein-like surface antigen
VGGGAEFAINEHWSIKGEYRFFNGNSQNYALGFADGTAVDLNIHTARFGINWNF